MMKIVALVLLFLAVTVPVAGYSWQFYSGHSYTVVSPALWGDAEAAAVALGGHLVTINDAMENEWILQNLMVPYQAVFSGYYAWIGLYQEPMSLEPSYGWKWASGEPLTYVNWEDSEPNNSEFNSPENWAIMYGINCPYYRYAPTPGRWNDSPDCEQFGIVEVPYAVPEPAAVATVLAGLAAVPVFRRRR